VVGLWARAEHRWQGPHWTLYSLAQPGNPQDESLRPLLEQVHAWLLSPQHCDPPSTAIIPGQTDRVRRCAAQEGAPVELRTTVTASRLGSRGTFADWGPAGRLHSNPFVTAEAELVLHRATSP
jgi:hypothetical protein